MDKKALLAYFERIDQALRSTATLYLVSSKLIRYDDLDRSDIQYLLTTARIPFTEVQQAAERLPAPFVHDPLIHDNLKNLKNDMAAWGLA